MKAAPHTPPPAVEAWEVLDLLCHLVEKSLVTYDEEAGRYQMLESVRQYAQHKLSESGEVDATRHRHGRFFATLAEGEPGADQITQLNAIEAEYDNLRAALDQAGDAGLRLAGSLGHFWVFRSHWREGYERLKRALEGASDEASPGRAEALYYAGTLAAFLHDHRSARDLMERALQMRRELGDDEGAIECLNGLGDAAYQRGDYEAARAFFSDVAVSEAADDLKVARAVGNIGIMDAAAGRYAEARSALERLLTIGRSVNRLTFQGIALNNLGFVILLQGEHEAAGALLREALEINRRVGNKVWQTTSHYGLCLLEIEGGHALPAWEHLRESLRITQEIENYEGGTEALCLFARLAALRGDAALATRFVAVFECEQQRQGTPTPVWEREIADQVRSWARTELSKEESDAAWAQGAKMTVRQAVECAFIEGDALVR